MEREKTNLTLSVCVCVWAHTECYIESFLPDVSNIEIDTHFYYCWQNFMLLDDSPPRKARVLWELSAENLGCQALIALFHWRNYPRFLNSGASSTHERRSRVLHFQWAGHESRRSYRGKKTAQRHTVISAVNPIFLPCSALLSGPCSHWPQQPGSAVSSWWL